MQKFQLTPSQDEEFRSEDRCGNAPCDLQRLPYLHCNDRARDGDPKYAIKNRRHCSLFAERSNGIHRDCLKIFLEFIVPSKNEKKETLEKCES